MDSRKRWPMLCGRWMVRDAWLVACRSGSRSSVRVAVASVLAALLVDQVVGLPLVGWAVTL